MPIRYANETSKYCNDLIMMAQTVNSVQDLENCITRHLLESDYDQHKVTMIVDYLKEMIAHETTEYNTGMHAIDSNFSAFVFTQEQTSMLEEYLPNVLMTDVHTDYERKFAFKYIQCVNMMQKHALIANVNSNKNILHIVDHLNHVRFTPTGKVDTTLVQKTGVYLLYLREFIVKHWKISLVAFLIIPAYLPVVVRFMQYIVKLLQYIFKLFC
jgi:2-oxo-4-hydroxy-4-carboxy--5-ureidoimidazoline (OHCU) decarboxylase